METESYYRSRIWVLNIHIGFSSFIFLYTFGVFNLCQDNIAASLSWGSSTSLYVNLFSSIIPAGALIGTIITGPLIARFGRRKTMLGNDLLYCISTGVLLMPSTATFGIGRFFTGLSAGIFMTLGPIYLTEMTPETMMGKIGPLMTIEDNLGLMSAYALGLALPTENYENDSFNYWWMFMFLFPVFICIYQFWYFMCVSTYDTPQYYFSKNMTEHVELALQVTYTPAGLAEGTRKLHHEVKMKGSGSFWKLFTDQKYRKMMRIGLLLCILNQLSGLTAILFYSSNIFRQLGGGVLLSRLLTFAMGAVNLICSAFSILLLHFVGRKKLLISGQVFLAIDLLLLGIFSGYASIGVAVPAVLIIFFFFFFSYSLGATFWLYISEILNDQTISVCCVINMSTAILVSFSFLPASEALGINNVFLFFAAMMALGSVYCACDLIETKDKEKEVILTDLKFYERVKTEFENNEDNNV